MNNLQNKNNLTVLAIESSCDETACAIVRNGREVVSNVVATQIEIHRRFGGVVPEIASRNHTLAIETVVKDALAQANMTKDDIDAVAVTYGAGLLGALLVGVNFAKALAYAWKKPLFAVSHVKGHIAANYIDSTLGPPYLCLLASGGHRACDSLFRNKSQGNENFHAIQMMRKGTFEMQRCLSYARQCLHRQNLMDEARLHF